MSYCLYPGCQKPQNPNETKFCQGCGSKLLLKERYRALKVIGQGSFGRTFLALDMEKSSQLPCVIKQFFPLAQDTKNVQKEAELWEQEAVQWDKLGKHPGIPQVCDRFEENRCQYLVQEFID
ncbi:4-Cys prefix domain-containing protein [Aerosakkonema sp. BLCC-F183]|uniref:4-Cys prefix domain-containing protein n=1 Tax=Aerosakkonema sp. BLCC-F183 TaxID=3342834 RepID=UPI0035BC731C